MTTNMTLTEYNDTFKNNDYYNYECSSKINDIKKFFNFMYSKNENEIKEKIEKKIKRSNYENISVYFICNFKAGRIALN